MAAEIAVFVGMGLCMVALGFATWLFRTVAKLLDLPFATLEWLLHGLGFLVALPFVLAIMVLMNGLDRVTWWVGGALLLAALVSFAGGGITLVREILSHERGTPARR
jgi:hypothetical protein